jgi:phospholipase C
MESRYWKNTSLFLTYDENGGIYDHVPPPHACTPWTPDLGDIAPNFMAEEDKEFAEKHANINTGFDRYGFRVPFILISPYAKRSYVSHNVYDHTSILRFIEAKFRLPALTARDANADAMFDLFDFQANGGRGPWATPPTAEISKMPHRDGRSWIDPAKLEECRRLFPKDGPKY